MTFRNSSWARSSRQHHRLASSWPWCLSSLPALFWDICSGVIYGKAAFEDAWRVVPTSNMAATSCPRLLSCPKRSACAESPRVPCRPLTGLNKPSNCVGAANIPGSIWRESLQRLISNPRGLWPRPSRVQRMTLRATCPLLAALVTLCSRSTKARPGTRYRFKPLPPIES